MNIFEDKMKIITPRQQEILDQAKQQGHVDVEDLAESFDVTPQTIRRDLNELCEQNYLGRVHGGAVYISGVTNFAYNSRRLLAVEEKHKIGKAAAALIPDNASVILNIGTTTEQVAISLCNHVGLMAITNNINIANILLESSDAEVFIAGGMARRSDGGIIGDSAVEFMKQFKVDYAIIGVSAIDQDGTLLDFDAREVSVSKTIIEHARTVILVTDAMKFERNAPIRIGNLSQINTLVVDAMPPLEIVKICDEYDIKIIIAIQNPDLLAKEETND